MNRVAPNIQPTEAMKMPKAKEYTEQEVFEFLDGLREMGGMNMFGAAVPLAAEFGMEKREARALLLKWMGSFNQRHPGA